MNTKLTKFYRHFEKYLANTSWIMSERLLNMSISSLITILVARYLGPEKFGVFSYAISLVSLFAIAGHAGLSGLVVRELVKFPAVENETIGTSFMLKGAGYLIGFIFILIFAFMTAENDNFEFWILFILSLGLLFQPFNIIDFWFQSRLESKYTTMSNTAALLVNAIIKISLILLGAQLVFFALANLIQSIIIAFLLVFFYCRNPSLSLKNWRVSIARAKALFSQSWMIFLGAIFAMVYLKIDQIMIKWLVSNSEVGVYAVAATLSEAWYFIPAAVVTSIFPKLITLKEDQPQDYIKRLQDVFDLLFMLSLTVAIAVTFLATPIVSIMFGNAYLESAAILIVHVWASIFIFMRTVFSRWILIENVLVFSLITQGMGAVVNVILNMLLIPKFGGLGAAYATLVSYATASYFVLFFYSKTRPIFWMMTKAMVSPFRYFILLKLYYFR